MKKLSSIILVCLSFLMVQTVSAQKNNFGINLGAALPMGDFGDIVKPGFGGDVSFDHYFNDNVHVGLEAGIRLFKIDVPDVVPTLPGLPNIEIEPMEYNENINIIPILLTAGYHKDANSMLDLYGELGAGVFISGSMLEGGDSTTDFGLSPRIGAAFEMSDNLFFDVNADYSIIFTEGNSTSWIGVNVGILMTL